MEQRIRREPEFGKCSSVDTFAKRISTLEHDLMVNSYSVLETRSIWKELDKLKREQCRARKQEEWDKEIETIHKKRKQLFERLSELRGEITEVDAALCIAWCIIYNRKQSREVTPDEVVSELLPMKEEEYRSLRRKHPILCQRIEQSQCIRLTYTHSVSGCLIYGTEHAVKEGLQIVADLMSWCKKTIPTTSLWIGVLLTKQGKYAQQLEAASHTLLHIDRQKKQITAEGSEHAVQHFQSLYDAFFANARHFALSAAAVAHLRADSHALFDQLIARCEGYCYADYARRDLVVFGSSPDLLQSAAVVDSLLAPFATVQEWLDLPDASRVSFLVGEGGAAARALSRRAHCRCTFSKRDEPCGVRLEGCRDDIQAAKTLIAAQLALYDRQNVTMTLRELALPILLNNRGQQVQQVQRDTDTHITINKAKLQCTIRGKEQDVARAQEALKIILADITAESLPLSRYVRGAFFGAKGQHIEELRKQFHVSVKCSEDAVCLEGRTESVAAAGAAVRAWLAKHAVRVVEGEKEAVGHEVIGNRGARVRELEKTYRVRVLQEEQADRTRVVLIGPTDAVQALGDTLSAALQQYTATHFTLCLTPEHFAHAPQLARPAIEQLRARHPRCTVAVVPSLGQLRCEGDAQHLPPLRAELQMLRETLKDEALFSCEVSAAYFGLVIGRDGSTIGALQAQHHVALRLLRDEERLLVWGREADFEALVADLRARIEAGEAVSEAVPVAPPQLANLLKDRCRCLREVQTATRTLVRLPDREGRTVTLSGTRANVRRALPLLADAMKGVFCYHYAYPAAVLKELLALPTFHVERVALATHCKLECDAGGLTLRGKWEAVHKAHAAVFEGLEQVAPLQFAHFPLDAGCVQALTTRDGKEGKSGDAAHGVPAVPVIRDGKEDKSGDAAHVVWEVAENAVYVWGGAEGVREAHARVQLEVARLASENRVVRVEGELVACLLKSKRAQLRELSESSGATLSVLPERDGVFVHGKSECVQRAADLLEELAQAHREVNAQLTSSSSVLEAFVKEYGSMLRQWESQYDGEIHVDRARGTISIRGKTKEGMSDLKFVVESMLEEVELKMEVDALNMTESESEREEPDHKSEIASLLGLDSLV